MKMKNKNCKSFWINVQSFDWDVSSPVSTPISVVPNHCSGDDKCSLSIHLGVPEKVKFNEGFFLGSVYFDVFTSLSAAAEGNQLNGQN